MSGPVAVAVADGRRRLGSEVRDESARRPRRYCKVRVRLVQRGGKREGPVGFGLVGFGLVGFGLVGFGIVGFGHAVRLAC
jgi:hypothetical protein